MPLRAWRYEIVDNRNKSNGFTIPTLTEEEKVMRQHCRNCKYYDDIYSNTCDYYLITGVRRGCPCGKGCTRFVKKEKRR